MEDNKVIIPIFAKTAIGTANKHIFVPTANTPQANAKLLAILKDPDNDFEEQDWENIRKCLENDADPNIKFGTLLNSLIHLAIQYNRKDLFDYLLQLGADINSQDKFGSTPLHAFISYRPTNFCIKNLLENKANTNATINSGYTPLLLANEKGHLDFIKPLIQYNADINQKLGDTTLLGWNIWTSNLSADKNLEGIKILCNAGASAINVDNFNHTAFHVAANKTKKIIKFLMTHVKFKNDDNDKIKNTIKTVLLVFNRLSHPLKSKRQENAIKFPIIPREIQILILSKLLSPNFFHKGLYKQCQGEHYKLHLELVNNHIECLKQILQIKNTRYETALDLRSKKNFLAFAHGYRTKAEKLLEGTTLQEDLETFNKKYPDITSIPADNLALQILEKHYAFEPK